MIITAKTKFKMIQLLRQHRISRGMTQAEVAKASGMHRLAYHRVEVGERILKARELRRICVALSINEAELWRAAERAAWRPQ